MSPKNLNVIKTPKNLLSKLSNKRIKDSFKEFEKNFEIKENFAVAVSGGPDSLALAFLSKVFSIKNNLNCKFFIVDHKLRKDSTNEANKVKLLLSKFDIKVELLTWNGKKPLSNIQSLARKKRYDLLLSKCKSLKISNLVTGHHIDDLFENFFIRIIRGSGLKGLTSLKKKTTVNKINLYRPLLDFKKETLEYISNQVFKFFVKDPSNKDIYFKRVKIRNIISDFKKSGLDKYKLSLTLKNLKISNNAIEFYTDQNKRLNSFLDKKNKKLILNKIFFNQPYEIVFRSLSDSLKIVGGNYFFPRGKKVDSILQKIEKGTFKKETLAGCIIKKVNQSLIITKES
tara:strand:- start:1210 stop:2235 length:1026 start_codon:yes stop_codon:yes gene_type:complete